MNIIIEGWEPTPVEKALMDGTFDEMVAGMDVDIEDIPDDLLDIKEFEEAMDDIKREIEQEFNNPEDE